MYFCEYSTYNLAIVLAYLLTEESFQFYIIWTDIISIYIKNASKCKFYYNIHLHTI
jgi:hypothetical protein